MANIQEVFELCDPDNSGEITIKEFVETSRSGEKRDKMSRLLGGRQFTLMTFMHIDENEGRGIDFNEFVKCNLIFDFVFKFMETKKIYW